MAVKRNRKHITGTELQTNKRSRREEDEETEKTNSTMVDRLTELPESLQVQILSSLETRRAVQTSMLSKSWASTWTCLPVLMFRSSGFKSLTRFDKFVDDTLSRRGSMKLDKLTFIRQGTCSARVLKKVFDYALSQGVKELEANVTLRCNNNKSWPIRSSDSLTSLRLQSEDTGCSFLGPRAGSFNNLTSFHLKGALITDLDPFSGFPSLEKLKLVSCKLQTNENTMNIYALQLSELTISYDTGYVNCCELTTPKLRYFKLKGNNIPRLKTHPGGLPVLDTVVVDYNGVCSRSQEKILFDSLLMLFNSCYNAKSLTVSSSVFHLLSLLPDELMKRCSPFRDLKWLTLDFSSFHYQKLFDGPWREWEEERKFLSDVKAYLLQKSHDAKCTTIYPKVPHTESPSSHSRGSQRARACKSAR